MKMKNIWITVIGAGALWAGVTSGSALIARQSFYPACALPCIENPTDLGDCTLSETACLCSNRVYLQAMVNCIDPLCLDEADRQQAAAASTEQCSLSGVDLATITPGLTAPVPATGVATTAIAAATAVAGEGQANMTTIAQAEFTETSVASAPAATNASFSGVAPQKSSNTGAIVGGIIGGLGTPTLLVAIFFIVRRQRRARLVAQLQVAATQNQTGPSMAFAGGGNSPGTPLKTPIGTPTAPVLPGAFYPFAAPAAPPPANRTPTTPAAPPPPAAAPPRPPPHRSSGENPGAQVPQAPPPAPPPSQPTSSPTTPPSQAPPAGNTTQPTRAHRPSSSEQQQQQPGVGVTSSAQLTPHQLAMMERMQRLNPEQLALLDRMTNNNTTTNNPAGEPQAGATDLPPPQYDFKSE